MILTPPPSDFNPKFSVAGVIVRVGDETLLIQRHRLSRNGLKWGLPAGKKEHGEELQEAAGRELFEETGIEVTLESLRYLKGFALRWPDAGYDFMYELFELVLDNKPTIVLAPEEHEDYVWIADHNLPLVTDLKDILEVCRTL